MIDKNTLFTGDNLFILCGLNSESVDLIYLDPPFNSKRMYDAPVGSKAEGSSFKDIWTWEDVNKYYLEKLAKTHPILAEFIFSLSMNGDKAMASYLTYMTQRVIEMHRVLKDTGSIYLHCDPTASHYIKIMLDDIFGKKSFRNEIVWAYDWGGRPRNSWGKKHDIIFYYSKNRDKWIFNDESVRVPYVDNTGKGHYSLLTPEKLEKGKIPTDVWNIQVIHTQSPERQGYPTQKPLALLERIIKASSNEGDIVLDPFCGCATACVASQQLGRKWIGIDIAEKSAQILINRLSDDAGMFKDFVPRLDIPKRTDIVECLITPTNKKDIKENLYKSQEGKCNGCLTELEIRHFEIDHIVPKAKGGGDYIENYQLLCGSCNRIKGDRPMKYLVQMVKARMDILRTKLTFGEDD